jgi:hypothetical protein
MSSGPMGVDFKEYTYNFFRYIVPDAVQHRISARNGWFVTRIRVGANGTAVNFRLRTSTSPAIAIASDGCLCLEPNGAHREDIYIDGQDALLLVEYWYQAIPSGAAFNIYVAP